MASLIFLFVIFAVGGLLLLGLIYIVVGVLHKIIHGKEKGEVLQGIKIVAGAAGIALACYLLYCIFS